MFLWSPSFGLKHSAEILTSGYCSTARSPRFWVTSVFYYCHGRGLGFNTYVFRWSLSWNLRLPQLAVTSGALKPYPNVTQILNDVVVRHVQVTGNSRLGRRWPLPSNLRWGQFGPTSGYCSEALNLPGNLKFIIFSWTSGTS